MDNIIGLEHYIRKGFNKINPMNTYAVFLDISKAFDTTWIQGLLYKLSAKGITGKTLAWLKNFLTNRTFNVQIGQTVSEDRELKIGVPQGSPLSPLLFSVMLLIFDFFIIFYSSYPSFNTLSNMVQASVQYYPGLVKKHEKIQTSITFILLKVRN
jgi:hypothetical protein